MFRTSAFVALLVIGCGGGNGSGGQPDAPPPDGRPYEPPFGNCAGGNGGTQPPNGSLCLVNPTTPTDPPVAVIEHEFVTYNGVPAVHISLVFDPNFVDNTYGANAVGWDRHSFNDLVGSDHATVIVLDANGDVVFDLDIDYISQDPDAPCGYSCLGVTGGEGNINVGDPAAILGVTTSLDTNLNEHGYCLTEDSPATDANCTANPMYPNWDFRVVYEIWLALSAFDPDPFGSAYMSFVHASPAKGGDNTVEVVPGECPCPEVDEGECGPPPSGGCTTSEDCTGGEFCYGGQCVPIVE